MTTTTWSLPALTDDPWVRADAFAVLARVRELTRTGSTELAADQHREPAASYCDPALWAREVGALHTLPLPVALSCELPAAGAYRSLDVAGTPVLLTRAPSGRLHAAINACRHRGAELVPPGTGVAERLVCPNHAWCYDLAGGLVRVEAADTFGEVNRAERGLVQLPVTERAGLVFVCLTPGAALDVDAWLGPQLLHLLEALDLAGCHHYATRTLEGPNWKVVLDGYLESYHIQSAHASSVLLSHLTNTATFDSWGPHVRSCFALRSGIGRAEASADLDDLAASVSAVYWLFPGLNISGGWGEQVAVSLVLPGRSWDVSHTVQHLLLRHPPPDDGVAAAATSSADRLRQVVEDEDYEIAWGTQRALPAMRGQDFVFGLNEPAVQHFHRSVARHLHGERVAAG